LEKLTITSIQAPNQDRIAAVLANYLGEKLGIACEFIADPPWQERERMIDTGHANIGWICGLPYVHKIDRAGVQIELLVAPVMANARYKGRPVYFSDVIVHSESNFTTFADLRGRRWAYNEPNSHSGYNLTRFMLAKMGEFDDFFEHVTEAGSHQAALQLLLDGKIDGTSIDSTVLEIELRHKPDLSTHLRKLATWGPSPIPPWVIHKQVPSHMRDKIRITLLEMDSDLKGKVVLADLGIKKFTQVNDTYYDPIREMEIKAQRVRLGNK
jgi:phosphonate transport system substrate-binding protein